MKNVLQMLILFTALNVQSQEYQKTENYYLTKVDKNLSMEEVQNISTVDIFLNNKDGKKLKKIAVNWEFYENDGIIRELYQPRLTNIQTIIQVNISNCACYCNEETYHWLINKKGEWIELPLIEEEDFEISQTTRNYIFKKNEIELVEEKFKIIDYNKGDMETIYKKVIKKYTWDGKVLK